MEFIHLPPPPQPVQCHPSCIFKVDNFRGLLGWRGRAWMLVNPDIKVIHHSIDASFLPHAARWAFTFMLRSRECVRDKWSVCMWMYQCITDHFPGHISSLSCHRPNNEKSPAYSEPALLLRLCKVQLINKRLWIFSTHLSCCTEPSIRAQQHASKDMKTREEMDVKAGRWLFKASWNAKEWNPFHPALRSVDCSLYMFVTAGEWGCGGVYIPRREDKREHDVKISVFYGNQGDENWDCSSWCVCKRLTFP